MSTTGQHRGYLSSSEREKVLSRYSTDYQHVPLKDKFFLEYGGHVGYVAHIIPAFASWRAGYRGYHLNRFGRGRTITLAIVALFPANAALVHTINIYATKSPYRSEKAWTYALRSFLLHQVGLLVSIVGPLAFTFFYAKTNNMIPIPDEMHKRVNHKVAAEQLFGRLRPYAKNIAITAGLSSIAMTYVGWTEYRESLNVLALQNRKTFSAIED